MFRFAFLSITYIVVVNITQYLLHQYFPGTDSWYLFICPVSGMFLLPSLNCLLFRISVLPLAPIYFVFLKVTIKNLFFVLTEEKI